MVKEYINSTINMVLYLHKDLKLACGRWASFERVAACELL